MRACIITERWPRGFDSSFGAVLVDRDAAGIAATGGEPLAPEDSLAAGVDLLGWRAD